MSETTIKPEFISVSQAAKYLSVSTDTLYRNITDGNIQAYRIGGKAVRLRMSDVHALAWPVGDNGVAGAK